MNCKVRSTNKTRGKCDCSNNLKCFTLAIQLNLILNSLSTLIIRYSRKTNLRTSLIISTHCASIAVKGRQGHLLMLISHFLYIIYKHYKRLKIGHDGCTVFCMVKSLFLGLIFGTYFQRNIRLTQMRQLSCHGVTLHCTCCKTKKRMDGKRMEKEESRKLSNFQ